MAPPSDQPPDPPPPAGTPDMQELTKTFQPPETPLAMDRQPGPSAAEPPLNTSTLPPALPSANPVSEAGGRLATAGTEQTAEQHAGIDPEVQARYAQLFGGGQAQPAASEASPSPGPANDLTPG